MTPTVEPLGLAMRNGIAATGALNRIMARSDCGVLTPLPNQSQSGCGITAATDTRVPPAVRSAEPNRTRKWLGSLGLAEK
jgi:hypothetical protein